MFKLKYETDLLLSVVYIFRSGGRRCRDRMTVGFTTTYQWISSLKLSVHIPQMSRSTRVCYTMYYLLVVGRWFSPGTIQLTTDN